MCRLFGFRSVIESQVHRSLLAAENALGVQSSGHPDGWGVAFYVDGAPHLTRSPTTAFGDKMFHRLSGVVSSQTVLAHVRKATQGGHSVFNCHPFQHGRWVFAHNGDIPQFEERRASLLSEVAPSLRRFILGETDSEVLFYLFLTLLRAEGGAAFGDVHAAMTALAKTVKRVRQLCDRDGAESLLTLMATDGEVLVATHGGKELYVSTYKKRCADRDRCAHLAPACEAPSSNGQVNHLIVSSEPLSGENVWQPLERGDIIGVDRGMRTFRSHVERRELPLVGT
jgi:predicted glutamine amidotransferase